MEFIFTDIDIESFVFADTAQAEVEGELPLPEGRRAADTEVLCANASTEVARVTAAAGAVVIEGRVRAELICRDTSVAADEETGAAGAVFAFGTSAAFRYTMDAPGVAEGMRVDASASVVNLNVAQGARLTFNSTVEMSCTAASAKPVRALTEVRGEGAEFRTGRIAYSRELRIGAGDARIREEVPARGVKRALCAFARPQVRTVRAGGDSAIVEGTVYACALVESLRGELESTPVQFQFTLEAPLETRPEGEAFAQLTVQGCDVYTQDENALCFELGLSVQIYECREREALIPTDAYIPGRKAGAAFTAARTDCAMLLRAGRAVCPVRMDEMLAMPEGMPKPERVVWCAARPLVTSCTAFSGEAKAEGIMNIRTVYESGGKFFSFTSPAPFSCAVKCEASCTDASCSIELLGASASLSGGGIAFSATADAVFRPFAVRNTGIVTGMEECAPDTGRRALLLCFAGQGETLFDIGRAHNVSREALVAANPGICEGLCEGQPVVFIGR